MYNINLVIYSYVVIIFAGLFFYCIGDIIIKYILRISLPISAKRVFAGLLTGTFVCVLCYSIIQTSGNTSSMLFIPIIGFYFLYVKRKQPVSPTVNIPPEKKVSVYILFGYSILVSLFLYVLFCYANLDNSFRFRPVEGDDYSYGILAQYLNKGFENLEFSKNFWTDTLHQPYHYFEIWLNALLYKIFRLNSVWTFSLIVPTILYIIMFWGLMSIVEQYKKLNLIAGGLCFILLFTTEISILLSKIGLSVFPYPSQYCSGLILTKIATVSLFSEAIILLLINKKNKEAFLVTLSLPIISFTTTPVAFAITGYLILKNIIYTKRIKYEYIVPFAVMLCLVAYYVFSGEKSINQNRFPLISEMKLRLFITNPISYSIRYIFPLLLVFLIDFKSCYGFCKRYCVEIFLFFIVSTGFSVILRPIAPDTVQFATVCYYGVFNVLFPSAILYLAKNRNIFVNTKYLLIFMTGCLLNVATVISFFSNNRYFSSATRLEYEELVAKNTQESVIRIGLIRPEDALAGWCDYNLANQNYLTTFLDAYQNDIIYYSIVKGTIGISKNTTFSILLEEAQKSNPSLTQEEFRPNFIEKVGINYIIVYQGGKIPENLSDRLQLLAKDADSEECFYKVLDM
jgi:hypothetical protein